MVVRCPLSHPTSLHSPFSVSKMTILVRQSQFYSILQLSFLPCRISPRLSLSSIHAFTLFFLLVPVPLPSLIPLNLQHRPPLSSYTAYSPFHRVPRPFRQKYTNSPTYLCAAQWRSSIEGRVPDRPTRLTRSRTLVILRPSSILQIRWSKTRGEDSFYFLFFIFLYLLVIPVQ